MKPTLDKLFDWGNELVAKEKITVAYGKEFVFPVIRKRYSKEVVVYTAHVYLNYTIEEIATNRNVSKNTIITQVNRVKQRKYLQDLAEEVAGHYKLSSYR